MLLRERKKWFPYNERDPVTLWFHRLSAKASIWITIVSVMTIEGVVDYFKIPYILPFAVHLPLCFFFITCLMLAWRKNGLKDKRHKWFGRFAWLSSYAVVVTGNFIVAIAIWRGH